MRTLTKLVAVLLLAVASGAGADPTPGDAPAVTAPTPVTPARKLSIGEMTTQAAQLRAKVEVDSRHIGFLQQQARKQKDVIKLNCVNDKMVELRAQQNIFDGTSDHLTDALAKDSPERGDLFDQLSSTAGQVQVLREGANACIGAPELHKQESGGSSHPLIPDDPTKDHAFDKGQIEPPGYCSPFN